MLLQRMLVNSKPGYKSTLYRKLPNFKLLKSRYMVKSFDAGKMSFQTLFLVKKISALSVLSDLDLQ